MAEYKLGMSGMTRRGCCAVLELGIAMWFCGITAAWLFWAHAVYTFFGIMS